MPVGLGARQFQVLEVGANVFTDVKVLVGGQAEAEAGGVDELRTAFAVSLGSTGDFRNASANEGLGNDDFGLAVVVLFGGIEGCKEGVHVMAVDGHRVPAQSLVECLRVLVLRDLGHRVEGHIVAVINEDQIVQAVVRGEGHGLTCHPFLKAAVAGDDNDVIVKNVMVGGVVLCRCHLAAQREAHGIAHTLPERTSGALDTHRFKRLRVAGRVAAQLAEVFDLFQRQVVAAQMQPGIDEHRTMACAENQTVAIEPFRGGRITVESVAEQHRTDFRHAQRQA